MALELAPERVRPMLMLAAYAGLRACEISNLRAEDIMWANDPPMLVVTNGKGGHQGAVPCRCCEREEAPAIAAGASLVRGVGLV